MDELFNHPLFFLIHVDVNRMSLVKPFGNKEMQKDIIGRGYRCISHLWGTADKAEDHIWRDHGISGIAWNVETRVEKRERLLQIFRYHEGYFWMDNLCMDQNVDPRDKPLEIMGDIYKKCRECICMLDYVWTSDRFKSEADEVEWMIEDVKLGHTPDPLGAYIQNVPRSRWHDRVWTWQEVVLPERIKFISEQANGHEYRPLSAYMFTKIGENMVSTTDVSHYKNSFRRLMMTITETVSLPATNIVETLKEIKRSPRKCFERRDYIYGITGLLDMQISPGLDETDAKKRLLEKLVVKNIPVGENGEEWGWDDLEDVYRNWWTSELVCKIEPVERNSTISHNPRRDKITITRDGEIDEEPTHDDMRDQIKFMLSIIPLNLGVTLELLAEASMSHRAIYGNTLRSRFLVSKSGFAPTTAYVNMSALFMSGLNVHKNVMDFTKLDKIYIYDMGHGHCILRESVDYDWWKISVIPRYLQGDEFSSLSGSAIVRELEDGSITPIGIYIVDAERQSQAVNPDIPRELLNKEM